MFKFDQLKQIAYLRKNGLDVDLGLTPGEFKLFLFLAVNPTESFSTEALVKGVGLTYSARSKSLYCHISAIRKKLGDYRDVLAHRSQSGYSFNLENL